MVNILAFWCFFFVLGMSHLLTPMTGAQRHDGTAVTIQALVAVGVSFQSMLTG